MVDKVASHIPVISIMICGSWSATRLPFWNASEFIIFCRKLVICGIHVFASVSVCYYIVRIWLYCASYSLLNEFFYIQEQFFSHCTNKKAGNLPALTYEIGVESSLRRAPSLPSASPNCNKGEIIFQIPVN